MRRHIVLTHAADADLREIWIYSFDHWGEATADLYLDALDQALQRCGSEPERGQPRDEVRPGTWSLLIRRHVVFYTFEDEQIVIQRVLHASMDPTLHTLDDDL